jgi:hypothetical protein
LLVDVSASALQLGRYIKYGGRDETLFSTIHGLIRASKIISGATYEAKPMQYTRHVLLWRGCAQDTKRLGTR